MVDIDSLINVLPISALEPARLASIDGLVDVPEDERWKHTLALLEPPAGARVPYVDPVRAIETLLRGEGVPANIAEACACSASAGMPNNGGVLERVCFYDFFESDSLQCMPVAVFADWLRKDWARTYRQAFDVTGNSQIGAVSPRQRRFDGGDVADFFERAADVVAHAPMLRGPDNWDRPYSLIDKPALPPAKAMIEFVPGAPWDDFDWTRKSETVSGASADFLRWRESIRPVARALEQKLGESVYHFADRDDDLDDDCVHRFLVLHWCCTWKPHSSFVRYLTGISCARDVSDLKAALIDAASYHHLYEMNDAFLGIEPINCRFEYPSSKRKLAGFVFFTPEAQQAAYTLEQQDIGAQVMLIASPELLDKDWIEAATVNCRGCSLWFQHNQVGF